MHEAGLTPSGTRNLNALPFGNTFTANPPGSLTRGIIYLYAKHIILHNCVMLC